MRKHQYRLLVMLLIVAVTVTGLAIKGENVSAQTSTARGITRDFVNLRSGPGLSFPTLVIIPPERTVDIIGRNAEGNWLQVTVDGQSGWLFRSYVSLTAGSIAALPVTSGETTPPPTTNTGTGTSTTGTSTTTTTTPFSGAVTGVTTTFVNLRNNATSTSAVIAVIDPNTNVEIIGRSGNNRWLKVIANGQEGWMFKSLVRFNSTVLSSLPILSGATSTTTTSTTGTTSTGTTPSTGTSSTGITTYPFSVGGPPGWTGEDGRINPYTYGTDAIVYCRDFNGHTTSRTYQGGGIVVYLYQGAVTGVVFYATEAQINAAGVPSGNPVLIRAESGFSLFRLSTGAFQMVGPNRSGGSFNISWEYCFSTSEGE